MEGVAKMLKVQLLRPRVFLLKQVWNDKKINMQTKIGILEAAVMTSFGNYFKTFYCNERHTNKLYLLLP